MKLNCSEDEEIGENKMIHTLKARTNKSQKAMNEIAAIMPDMANRRTHHVAGIGYVVYIEDADRNVIAHCYASDGKIILNVK